MKKLLPFLSLLLFAYSCEKEPTVEPINSAGSYTHETVVDGIERDFIVYVPETATGPEIPPVMIMLHDAGEVGAKYHNDVNGWKQKAEAEGFVAIFPFNTLLLLLQ